jgi:hypothetical protein
MERVNTPARIEATQSKIADLLATHAEWFCTISGGDVQALGRSELDIAIAQGRLILTSWTEKGSRSWKIFSWEWTGEKINLEASRRMGAERPLIELIPRASASSIALTVKAARQARCEALGRLACSMQSAAKLERASLSPGARRGQPGKYARIILRQRHQRIAVIGCIASSRPSDADTFLSAALIWFKRTSERARSPYFQKLWLVVEPSLAKPIIQRIALLRQALKDSIAVYKVDQQLSELQPVKIPPREDLWKKRLKRFPPVPVPEFTEIAKRLTAIAPQAIDVVNARHGETLRYFGLPFARVRKVMGSERVWFGVEGSRRRMMDEKTENELTDLLIDLLEHRSANAPDHHHALYRNAAEAWLESLLRRDITRLDPGFDNRPSSCAVSDRARRRGRRASD